MNRKYMRLKSCPKCGGDVLIDRAYEDFDEVCIQCGYRVYIYGPFQKKAQTELDDSVSVIGRPEKQKVA